MAGAYPLKFQENHIIFISVGIFEVIPLLDGYILLDWPVQQHSWEARCFSFWAEGGFYFEKLKKVSWFPLLLKINFIVGLKLIYIRLITHVVINKNMKTASQSASRLLKYPMRERNLSPHGFDFSDFLFAS